MRGGASYIRGARIYVRMRKERLIIIRRAGAFNAWFSTKFKGLVPPVLPRCLLFARGEGRGGAVDSDAIGLLRRRLLLPRGL